MRLNIMIPKGWASLILKSSTNRMECSTDTQRKAKSEPEWNHIMKQKHKLEEIVS